MAYVFYEQKFFQKFNNLLEVSEPNKWEILKLKTNQNEFFYLKLFYLQGLIKIKKQKLINFEKKNQKLKKLVNHFQEKLEIFLEINLIFTQTKDIYKIEIDYFLSQCKYFLYLSENLFESFLEDECSFFLNWKTIFKTIKKNSNLYNCHEIVEINENINNLNENIDFLLNKIKIDSNLKIQLFFYKEKNENYEKTFLKLESPKKFGRKPILKKSKLFFQNNLDKNTLSYVNSLKIDLNNNSYLNIYNEYLKTKGLDELKFCYEPYTIDNLSSSSNSVLNLKINLDENESKSNEENESKLDEENQFKSNEENESKSNEENESKSNEENESKSNKENESKLNEENKSKLNDENKNKLFNNNETKFNDESYVKNNENNEIKKNYEKEKKNNYVTEPVASCGYKLNSKDESIFKDENYSKLIKEKKMKLDLEKELSLVVQEDFSFNDENFSFLENDYSLNKTSQNKKSDMLSTNEKNENLNSNNTNHDSEKIKHDSLLKENSNFKLDNKCELESSFNNSTETDINLNEPKNIEKTKLTNNLTQNSTQEVILIDNIISQTLQNESDSIDLITQNTYTISESKMTEESQVSKIFLNQENLSENILVTEEIKQLNVDETVKRKKNINVVDLDCSLIDLETKNPSFQIEVKQLTNDLVFDMTGYTLDDLNKNIFDPNEIQTSIDLSLTNSSRSQTPISNDKTISDNKTQEDYNLSSQIQFK